jgi:DNA replication protein DnaC
MVQDRAGKLVLLGSNGTGKTHLAVGIVRVLGGAIYSMYEITTRIRASYVSGAKENELQIVDELARIPMLAIDEIGRTKGSDAETNWLSYIVDKRHARGLPLMLISNKHTRKTCPDGGCQNCLENYISEDIMSRLAEDGYLVNMIGEDYRRKKRAKL